MKIRIYFLFCIQIEHTSTDQCLYKTIQPCLETIKVHYSYQSECNLFIRTGKMLSTPRPYVFMEAHYIFIERWWAATK